MTLKNCYTCRKGDFYPPQPATAFDPADEAFFWCEPVGITNSDEIDRDFACEDWDPRSGCYSRDSDLYDNLAENTSPDHAQRRMPEMVEAGVTSCGLALVI